MFNQTIIIGNRTVDMKEIYYIVELSEKTIRHKLKYRMKSKINIVDCTDGRPEKTMIFL